MLNLFDEYSEYIDMDLPGADIVYYPNFLPQEEVVTLFKSLFSEVDWLQDDICVYGKTYPQPRLTHLFAENDIPYSYSNVTMYPSPFSEVLFSIKKRIENITGAKFTTCLANLYRDGNDSNGWHADDEKELGQDPIIASVSLGAERWFHLKHKTDRSIKKKLLLKPGSLLLMGSGTQQNYLHQIPKTKKVAAPRINLTYRKIV